MDLSTIQAKAQAREYTTGDEFFSDLKLIRDNCYAYCKGRYDELLPLADQLLAYAEKYFGDLKQKSVT